MEYNNVSQDSLVPYTTGMRPWNWKDRQLMRWTEGLPRARQPTPHIMTTSVKKKRRVVVIGVSLLIRTEGSIC